MKRYTTYDSNTQTVIAERRPWPHVDGVTVPTLPAGVYLLEEINGDDPAIDPATQRLGGWGEPVFDTTAGTATRSREIVALTADELAEVARKTKRDDMAAQWHALPQYIRSHFHPLYVVANEFLDRGTPDGDQMALMLVDETEPVPKVADNPTRLQIFNNVKSQFKAAIEELII